MKPQVIRLRLSWGLFPWVTKETSQWLEFGRSEQALTMSRRVAARILRRIRSWGGHRPQVIK